MDSEIVVLCVVWPSDLPSLFVILSFLSSIFREFSGVILLLPPFLSNFFLQNVHFLPEAF